MRKAGDEMDQLSQFWPLDNWVRKSHVQFTDVEGRMEAAGLA